MHRFSTRLRDWFAGFAALLAIALMTADAPGQQRGRTPANDAAAIVDEPRGGWPEPRTARSILIEPDRDVRFDLTELRTRLSILNQSRPRSSRHTEAPMPGKLHERPATSGGAAALKPRPLLGRTAAAPSSNALAPGALTDPLVSATFRAGEDNLRSIPPDTAGAVGPSHIVTALNSEIFFLNRDGTEAAPPITLADFFDEPLASFETPFDPRIEYDPADRRWYIVATAGAFFSNSQIVLAISDTEDPTRSWRVLSFRADILRQTSADFPGFGYNARWLAVTGNMYANATGLFVGAGMWVVEKSSLDVGSIRIHSFPPAFDVGPSYGGTDSFGFSMQPAVHHDPTEQDIYLADVALYNPAGTPPLMRLSRITGEDDAPVWSPIDGGIAPGTGLIELPYLFGFNVPRTPQATTTYRTDGGDVRISSTPKFRNDRLWITHTGGLPPGSENRAAAYWYELDPFALEQDLDPVVQSGVIDGGPDTSTIFPSIAVNANNDAIIGFTRATPDTFIAAGLATRLADDPPGTTRPVEIFQEGLDTFGASRWGDYSAAVTDPNDDTTLWTIQSFAELRSFDPLSTRWGVQWARVGPGPDDPFCEADLTTTGAAVFGQEGYGFPDGVVDLDDLGYFLLYWLQSFAARADLTTTGGTIPGTSGFGVPDGVVDLDDLGYFLSFWLTACA